jgi:hypothetical protein
MMAKIFINFRNGDGEWAAKMIRTALEHRFGEGSVFLSFEDVPIGSQWRDSLLENARSCDVFLAVIGPKWLTIEGKDGRQRIFADDDWVRREIAVALAAGRAVTPVMLGDTPRFKSSDGLPDDIKGLADKQGARLDVRKFEGDQAGLEKKLMEVVPDLNPRRQRNKVNVDSKLVVGTLKGTVNIVKTDGEAEGLDVTSDAQVETIEENAEFSVLNEVAAEDFARGKDDRG